MAMPLVQSRYRLYKEGTARIAQWLAKTADRQLGMKWKTYGSPSKRTQDTRTSNTNGTLLFWRDHDIGAMIT